MEDKTKEIEDKTKEIEDLKKRVEYWKRKHWEVLEEKWELEKKLPENSLLRLVYLINEIIGIVNNTDDIKITYNRDKRKLVDVFEEFDKHYLNIVTEDEDGKQYLDCINEQYFFYQIFNGEVIHIEDNSWDKC